MVSREPLVVSEIAKPKAWWQRPSRRSDVLTALAFLSPSLLIFGVFVFFPLGYTFWLSFHKWNMIKPLKPFVGLNNYVDLLTGANFWQVLRNTVLYTAGTVSITITLALILAVVLNQPLRGRTIYRSAIFSPAVTANVAVAMLWLWIFDPQYGLLNSALRFVHLPALKWLGDPNWALPALMLMGIWKLTGYDMVILLAGLQNIPTAIYEAARIDGAGRFASFRHITLPLLTPITFFLVVVSIISSFQVFDQIYVMTQGGPINSTNVFVYYLYQNAFKFYEAGYASAIAVVFFAIILSFTVLQVRLSQLWVRY